MTGELVGSFLEVYRAFGGHEKTREGALVLSVDAASEALQLLSRLKKNSRVSAEDFRKGLFDLQSDIILGFGWPTWIYRGKKENRTSKEVIRMARLSEQPLRGTWWLGVNRGTRFPEAAARLVRELAASIELQRKLADIGAIPTLKAVPAIVAERTAFEKSKPVPPLSNWASIAVLLARQISQQSFQTIRGQLEFER